MRLPTALALTASLAVSLGAVDASAAPCRDAKGHFTKCPTPSAAPAGKCRDAKGHFAKCGSAGAKPA